MEELFIETPAGHIRIDEEIIKKYHIRKGTLSPFTGSLIVGKDGEFNEKEPARESKEKHPLEETKEDGIVELDNGIMLSTSEILDISHGADSNE